MTNLINKPFYTLTFKHKENTLTVEYACGCAFHSDTNSVPGYCPDHNAVYVGLDINRFDVEGKNMGELFTANALH